jgi:heme peroxidase
MDSTTPPDSSRSPQGRPTGPTGLSRRSLLRAGGAGLGAAALTGLGATSARADVSGGGGGCPMHSGPFTPSATFGRLFPGLPPFASGSERLRSALLAIGALGGPLDARDDLFGPDGGPVKLITDPNLSAVNRNNPRDTAGMTFIGQFIDHDLTFDATSQLGVPTEPTTSPNGRSARFDLDSVYGAGPVIQPELYDPSDPVKLHVESGGLFEDLPRRADGSAVVADIRNDSNLLISGLHAAFLKFHNHAVDAVRRPGDDPMRVFLAARAETTWHYQWLVVNRVLPAFVGQPLVDKLLAARRPLGGNGGPAYIPVEFSGAAYRFGHSMVRPSYRANLAGDGGAPFFGLIFDSRVVIADGANPTSDPGDLRGGFRAPRRFVGWQTFFDFGGAHTTDVRPNKLIDPVLSTPLFALPTSAIAHVVGAPGPVALPQRTLLRHLTWSLPSGQSVARQLGVPAVGRADLQDFAAYDASFARSTPLWLYVLREAQLVNGGEFLGPVGGRIVAEVMLGLLFADPGSYLCREPSWRPHLRGASDGYGIADFLRFAGVDPDSRGQ